MGFTDYEMLIREWGWIILAAILLGLEILAPGVFFLFFAFAAFIVAAISWLFNFGWQIEVLIFALIGLASMYAGRRFLKKDREKLAEHPINDPMMALVGQIVVVETAIKNGTGKAKINDSLWTIIGDDAEIGANVKIVDKKDEKFMVEAV